MNNLPIWPGLAELQTTTQELEHVARAIDNLYMRGGSLHFYACGEQDAVAFRFYRNCQMQSYAEWHTNAHGKPFAAILRLHAAVVGLNFEEWMKGGVVPDEV